MSSLTRTALVLLVMLFGAQATAEAQSTSKRTRDRNMLTAEEIEGSTAATVHQLIQQKRPHWLSTRGTATLRIQTRTDMAGQPFERAVDPEIIVYVDEVRNGNQEVLRSMPLEAVDSIEYLNAASATQRFGTNHPHGAILVRRKIR